MNLEKNITRRDFIRSAGLGSIGLALKPTLLYSQTKPSKVIFKDALLTKEPELRQRHLDYIVSKEQSSYVARAFYDHDRSMAKREVRSYIQKALNDPEVFKLLETWYLEDPRFSGIEEKERHSIIRGFLQSHEGKKEIEKNLKEEMEKGLIKRLDSGVATVLGYPFDFGKKVKPNLYVFGRAFESASFDFGTGVFTEPPTEERIRAMLQHEYVHAMDKYQGIKLEDKLEINNSNYTKIDPQAYDFVTETRAYFKQIEFSRQFGTSHPAYISSILGLAMFMNERGKYLKPENFNPFDRSLIRHQMVRYKKFIPEILQVLERIIVKR